MTAPLRFASTAALIALAGLGVLIAWGWADWVATRRRWERRGTDCD